MAAHLALTSLDDVAVVGGHDDDSTGEPRAFQQRPQVFDGLRSPHRARRIGAVERVVDRGEGAGRQGLAAGVVEGGAYVMRVREAELRGLRRLLVKEPGSSQTMGPGEIRVAS